MKPRVVYGERVWASAFARLEERQTLLHGDVPCRVTWKHYDPDWVMFTYRAHKQQRTMIVRKGDPLLLELK